MVRVCSIPSWFSWALEPPWKIASPFWPWTTVSEPSAPTNTGWGSTVSMVAEPSAAQIHIIDTIASKLFVWCPFGIKEPLKLSPSSIWKLNWSCRGLGHRRQLVMHSSPHFNACNAAVFIAFVVTGHFGNRLLSPSNVTVISVSL